MTARTCSDCPKTISANSKYGRCRSCTMKAINADPDIVASRSERTARTRRDPEFRRRHSIACATAKRAKMDANPAEVERLREWGRNHGGSGERTPEARRAARAKLLAWCPEEYWLENQRLKRAGFLLPDRQRIIVEAIAAAERVRLEAMTPLERDLERLAKGARLVRKFAPDRVPETFTLGGVATGML